MKLGRPKDRVATLTALFTRHKSSGQGHNLNVSIKDPYISNEGVFIITNQSTEVKNEAGNTMFLPAIFGSFSISF